MDMRIRKNRRLMTGMAAIMLLIGLVFGIALLKPAMVKADTPVLNGWDETKTHYYRNGKMLKKQQKINGHWYYFDKKTGEAVKNDFQVIKKKSGPKTCYYDENGMLVKGERKIGKYWYYFNKKTGAMKVNGFQTVKSGDLVKKCYYNAKGRRVRGEKKVGKYWYYFDTKTGAMKTDCFQTVRTKNKTCYYNAKGRRVTGSIKVDGSKWFTADPATGDIRETKICIDAGHQTNANLGQEPIGPGAGTTKTKVTGGAQGVATGKEEYQLNLEIAKLVKKELKSRGLKVVLTRTKNNVNISNSQRAQKANKAKAAAYVIIHADADSASASGAHTICNTPGNPFSGKLYKQDRLLAEKVINAYCKATGFRNRGVSERNDLSGLNWSKVPTCFIEMGFLSNASEDVKMSTPSMQKKMAKGIADGIEEYLEKSN